MVIMLYCTAKKYWNDHTAWELVRPNVARLIGHDIWVIGHTQKPGWDDHHYDIASYWCDTYYHLDSYHIGTDVGTVWRSLAYSPTPQEKQLSLFQKKTDLRGRGECHDDIG